MNEKLGTGAFHSKKDKRNIKHSDLAVATTPLVKGGVDYLPTEIEHQHLVGICTAISRVQLREKQTGKKYSPEFQYLLQKKFYDMNWTEGSAILNANKVAKNYGFLPLNLWTYTTEQDRYLPYAQYIAKLQAIPDTEIQRLIGLCVDKIAGYAQVDVTDAQAVAQAIVNSPNQSGILCRYGCNSNWWTPSWLPKDIDPLRNAPETSGHAIINCKFDYTTSLMQKLANTWGITWDLQGMANINWGNYPMTEAFVDLLFQPMFKFNNDMRIGSKLSPDVKELQKRLGMPLILQTGYFFLWTQLAVKNYQIGKGLKPDGIVGPQTRATLNS